jgi:C-terminal processing protease CtpA/Prc
MPAEIGNRLVDISIELIDKLYVHLPLKRSMYAVNPIQRLRLLERRLNAPQRPMSERQFYNEMLSIFSQLRDLHTSFVLPEPFRSATAYLPFRLEACSEGGQRTYVVSELMAEAPKQPGFDRGAEVTHWNGVAIERAVASNAERESGSNAAARHAQGLASMTIRWLGQSLPPDEDWVDVSYRPASGRTSKTRVARFKWHVFIQKSGAEHEVARAGGMSVHLGMDTRGEVERQVRHFLFGRRRRVGPASRHFGSADELRSTMPEVFPSSRDVHTPHGRFAYVRIATFNVDSDTAFLDEFIRIVGQLSQDGLILDVRGNGGGLIHAGERLLQLLTPKRVEPCRFHFLNSTRTEQISRRRAFNGWNGSIAQAVETGAEYSQGLSLLPAAAYNDVGQKYQGPVVLVTDALCYSTTDIFAAGFQDNQIGQILGVDENTGAGGANVWEYSLIADLLRRRAHFPRELPGKASFRFAVRRVTRIGKASGLPLEDLGVVPDQLHEFTRNDVLQRNVDLIAHAATMLAGMPRQRLIATPTAGQLVRVDCANIDCIDAYLQGRPLSSTRVRNPSFNLQVPRAGRFRRELCLQGFRKGQLVAATRVPLAPVPRSNSRSQD